MSTVVQINQLQTEDSTVKVFEIVGELDESNLSELEAVLNPVIADESILKIVLKLDDLKFLSSKIIGFLAHAYNKFNGTERQIIFAGCSATINDILSIVGLNQMIPCLPSVQEALALPKPQI